MTYDQLMELVKKAAPQAEILGTCCWDSMPLSRRELMELMLELFSATGVNPTLDELDDVRTVDQLLNLLIAKQ